MSQTYERWLAEANEKALSDDRERAAVESYRKGLLAAIVDADHASYAALQGKDWDDAVYWSNESTRLKVILHGLTSHTE
jgi:hypothetical protein